MPSEFEFKAHSLKKHEEINQILNASLAAVEPSQAVRRFFRLQGNHLSVGEKNYELDSTRRIRVVGAGKASVAMLQALVDILDDRIDGGVVIAKNVPAGMERIGCVEVLEGSHPVTSNKSVLATQQMVASLEGLTAEDIVICLISGGGSALMTDPRPGVSLQDLQTLNRLLLACGADIEDFNTLRKHLDRVKGGGLRRLTAPADVISLLISDVVGSRLEVIASGPTAPDPSTFLDAQHVVEKYFLLEKLPKSIRDILQRGVAGEIEETLKPGDPIFKRTYHLVVGDNRQAALAGLEKALALGFNTLLLTTSLQGEARQAGKFLANIMQQIHLTGEPINAPACIIAGGETTVTLHGKGYGGRNQEMALGAVTELAGQKDVILATLATDGEDGPTDAAGAVVTGDTLLRAQSAGMSPEAFLDNNDAYPFFKNLDDLLRPGSTGTNVNDLAFGFVY
jgi:glycerate 2-kinase